MKKCYILLKFPHNVRNSTFPLYVWSEIMADISFMKEIFDIRVIDAKSPDIFKINPG